MEGARRELGFTRALAAALATAAVLAAAGCSGTAGDALRSDPAAEPVTTTRPARAFAPLIHHHPNERSFPIGATRFLQRSTLKWKGGRCGSLETVATGRIADRKTAEGVPRLRPARLGGKQPPYRRRQLGSDCQPTSPRAYATTELTRPFHVADERPPGLRLDTGFYVDVLTDSYDGDPRFERRDGARLLAGTPAYHQREAIEVAGRPAVRFSYWFLYAHHELHDSAGDRLTSHEGDWERVDVVAERAARPGRWRPLAVRLHHDGAIRRVRWRATRAVGDDGMPTPTGSHPVLFSARTSHTFYPAPGRHHRRVELDRRATALERAEDCLARGTAGCVQWRTWERLRPVRSRPWYGFGGGWGFAFLDDYATGPLGPSPHRR